MAKKFPAETTLDDILVEIRSAHQNKNVGKVPQVVLKSGPRAYRTAALFQILDEAGQHHHFSLTIHCIDKSKDGWAFDQKRYVTLEDKELKTLVAFLNTALDTKLPDDGTYHLINDSTFGGIKHLLEAARQAGSAEKLQLVQFIIENLNAEDVSPEQLQTVLKNGSGEVVRALAVSAKLVEYRRVVAELQQMIDENTASEAAYQKLLKTNPWLFGSEYSCLLERRNWTRDDKLDYMLRRTADGYLEVVEIKTPIVQPLFNKDKSHDSAYPAAPLAEVLGQVIRYVEEVERNRDSIIAKDKEDPLKIRARIIIGRDGDASQVQSLRKFNAHLHGIEILTFDQLLKIGGRVLNVFEREESQPVSGTVADEWSPDDDIPF